MNALKPKSSLWKYAGKNPSNDADIWDHLDGTRILSSVHDVSESGLEYHVSISKLGQRCAPSDALEVLRGIDSGFPVEQWDEDNHLPGIARHYWAHTDPAKRKPCECKANEKPHVEGDYLWRELGNSK